MLEKGPPLMGRGVKNIVLIELFNRALGLVRRVCTSSWFWHEQVGSRAASSEETVRSWGQAAGIGFENRGELLSGSYKTCEERPEADS